MKTLFAVGLLLVAMAAFDSVDGATVAKTLTVEVGKKSPEVIKTHLGPSLHGCSVSIHEIGRTKIFCRT